MTIRRAPLVLSATAVGLAATLGFHAHHPEAAASSSTPAAATKPAVAPSTSSSSSKSTSSSKTVTSDAVSTPYGDVQLKVTFANGKITKIETVSLPADDPKSQEINAYAAPQLTQSALSRQDGTVDAVSGATFTSTGYQTALQSALDQAGSSALSAGAAS
jgi:uncharacterized protein with FMN-binding domain